MTSLTPEEIGGLAALVDAMAELDELRLLPKNWDGYDADPINPAIVEAAKDLLDRLPHGIILCKPKVVPMTKGRLQLEWNDRDGKRALEIEFASPSHVCYLQIDDHEGSEVQALVSLTEPWKLYDLIRWISE